MLIYQCGERAGDRTQDPVIKSHVLYRLSYALAFKARCVGAPLLPVNSTAPRINAAAGASVSPAKEPLGDTNLGRLHVRPISRPRGRSIGWQRMSAVGSRPTRRRVGPTLRSPIVNQTLTRD
jgi:hypothetical protein